jgi:hypothetical protein
MWNLRKTKHLIAGNETKGFLKKEELTSIILTFTNFKLSNINNSKILGFQMQNI